MNKNSLFSFVLLAVLAASASAASHPIESVVLPPCVVAAPRFAPAEEKVNASLNLMRTEAKLPAISALELITAPKPGIQGNSVVRLTPDYPSNRLVKS